MSAQPPSAARLSATSRFVPGVATLASYQRSWLRGDLVAGVTVAAYLIPQVMAYAEVAGLPPVVGLWTAIAPLLVYALLGSSRQLSVGPESTTALMTALALSPVVATLGADRALDVAAILAFMVGGVCLVAGLARLGFLAQLLSKPVLIGYMAGIAVLMIVSQLGKITGRSVSGDGVWERVRDTLTHLGDVNWPTVALATGVVVALVLARRFLPRLPGPLLVVVAAAIVVALADLERRGVATIGAIPSGLPDIGLPNLDGIDLAGLILPAIGIAVVGYSDNALTGRAFADRRGERIDANQEFIALAGSNVAAGFVNGFPVSSSASRTALGDSVGSRTQLHSIAALVTVLIVVLAAGSLLARFPAAALGGLVVYAGARLVDVPAFRRLWSFRTSESLLALATTIAVASTDVLIGIGVAIGLSVLDLLRRIVNPHDGVLGYVPGVAGMHDVDDYPTAIQVPGLVVYRYDAPLFFANTENFVQRAREAVAHADGPVEWFLLNTEANTQIDLTAIEALESLRVELADRGIRFAMARVKAELFDELGRAGFVALVGKRYIFPTLPTAVAAYADEYAGRHGHPPAGLPLT